MSRPEQFVVTSGPARLEGERWSLRTPARPSSVRPTAVLLHSGVTDRRSWSRVAEDLVQDLDVVTYDRNGFGGSPPLSGAPQDHTDALAVLDAQTAGPVWLVGNSAGGELAVDVALGLARTEPERVAGLVLIAAGISGAPEPEPLDPPTQALSDALDQAIDAGDLAEANRIEAHIWLDGPAEVEGRVGGPARELFLEMNAIALSNEAEAGAAAAPAPTDAWVRLDELTMPVLVICGDLDVPFFVDLGREVASRLPAGRFEPLPGRGHLPSLEDPVQLADLIRSAVLA